MNVGDIPYYVWGCFGTLFFLLAALSVMELVQIMNMRIKGWCMAGILVNFFISAGCMFVFERVYCIYNGFAYGKLELIFVRLPVMLFMIMLFVVATGEFCLWRWILRKSRDQLTPFSLKEGLDQLSDGIFLCTGDGIPLLVNRKMHEIAVEVFGVDGVNRLYPSMTREELLVQEGLKTERTERGRLLVFLEDGSVWELIEHETEQNYDSVIVGRKTAFFELLAYDVTELYNKRKELKLRNEHLTAVNNQIREYSRNLDAITREKEMLAAKIRLHDDVGRCLVALRSYLADSNIDRDSLVALWRNTVSVLKQEAEHEERTDRMEVLSKAALAVDVSLHFDGEIPKAAEELCAFAVHECLTNTVKHADGKNLYIVFSGDDRSYTVEITNDGAPPKGDVVETGGLSNLRKIVEQQGGRMEVYSHPRFLLRIIKG